MLDHPNAVVFYMPVLLSNIFFYSLHLHLETPSFSEGFILLVSTGLTATLAHQGITRAFAKSEALMYYF